MGKSPRTKKPSRSGARPKGKPGQKPKPEFKPAPKLKPEPPAADLAGLAVDALPAEAKDREAAEKLVVTDGGEGARRRDGGRPQETDPDRRPPVSEKLSPDLEYVELSADMIDAWNLYAILKKPKWILSDPERDQLCKKLPPVLGKYLPESITNNTPEISLALTLMAIARARLKIPDLKKLFRKTQKPAAAEPAAAEPAAGAAGPAADRDWREYGRRKFSEAAANVSSQV